MNQENREINLRVERVLIDYNKHLSRGKVEQGWDYFLFVCLFVFETELVDRRDKIFVYWIMLV